MALEVLKRYPITIDGETLAIGTASELAVALDVLQGQYDRAVLEQLRPHLADVVGGPPGLGGVLKSLAGEDQLYLIAALGARLVESVRSAEYLRNLLARVSLVEVERGLLETLGASGLRRLIQTPEELAEVLEWVYGDCDDLVLDLLGSDHLGRILADGQGLSRVLNCLSEPQQIGLIERIGWERVVALVRSARDLAYLLRALPASISRELLRQYSRERLIGLIGNEREWALLCRRLEPDEASYLYAALGVADNA